MTSSLNEPTSHETANEQCCDATNCIPVITLDSPDSDHCDPSASQCISISDSRCIRHAYAESPAPLPEDAPDTNTLDVIRKLAAELVGTGLLVMIVVASGISAESLTDDVGIQLLINAVATMAGLYGLITIFGPVSGANFNPIVSMVDVCYKDMTLLTLGMYCLSQITGAIVGCILANVMYDEVPVTISEKERFGYGLWISEVIATCTLILVIHGCIRTGEETSVPSVVSLWVGGGYFFTSSAIFANPAVTIGRVFTDTFAGIEPRSAGVYIGFQIIGAILGYGMTRGLYPLMPQPLKKGDNLYRRACVLELQDFYTKGGYY